MTIYQYKNAYRYNSDSLVLCDFVRGCISRCDSALDIGCGSGILGLYVAREYGARIACMDIQWQNVLLSAYNFAANGYGGEFLWGDISSDEIYLLDSKTPQTSASNERLASEASKCKTPSNGCYEREDSNAGALPATSEIHATSEISFDSKTAATAPTSEIRTTNEISFDGKSPKQARLIAQEKNPAQQAKFTQQTKFDAITNPAQQARLMTQQEKLMQQTKFTALSKRSYNNSFELIICNPPFYNACNHAQNPHQNISKNAEFMPLSALISSAHKLLRPRGSFVFCYESLGFDWVIYQLVSHGFGIELVQFFSTAKAKNPRLMCIKARKCIHPQIKILPHQSYDDEIFMGRVYGGSGFDSADICIDEIRSYFDKS